MLKVRPVISKQVEESSSIRRLGHLGKQIFFANRARPTEASAFAAGTNGHPPRKTGKFQADRFRLGPTSTPTWIIATATTPLLASKGSDQYARSPGRRPPAA